MSNFFEQHTYRTESNLMEDLIEESIQVRGHEVLYIPRKYVSQDILMNEIISSEFKSYYPIHIYLEETGGWYQNDAMYSKFGLSFGGPSAKFVLSKRKFREIIPNEELKVNGTPGIGDLIYDPSIQLFFEIKDIMTDDPYKSSGKQFIFRLLAEPWKYNQEEFEKTMVISDEDGTNIISEFKKSFETAIQEIGSADSDLTIDDIQKSVDEDLFVDHINVDNTGEYEDNVDKEQSKDIHNNVTKVINKIETDKKIISKQDFGFN